MVNKKLATLLVSAVTLGQVGLVSTLFAQADSQVPSLDTSSEKLEVASVIQHLETESSDVMGKAIRPTSPDVHMIGNGEGTLPTIIQVLPQDDNVTSLFVNSSEILRYSGTVADMTSYERVKVIADRLSEMLESDASAAKNIRPELVDGETGGKIAVISVGDSVIATVDAETAKAAHEASPQLAFLYSNRLRKVLGQVALEEKEFAVMLHPTPEYKGSGRVLVGMASWYGPHFHGRRAADGSRFNMHAMTAAHKTLPFGTMLRVVNRRNNKSCLVKVTDRGPFIPGRMIDLSKGAAKKLGMLGSGVAKVSIEVVNRS